MSGSGPRIQRLVLALVLFSIPAMVHSQEPSPEKIAAAQFLDERSEQFSQLAFKIWSLAEVGYQEEQSSTPLQNELKRAGFTVETGVAGMPTAFIASWGSGSPAIAWH